MRFWQTTILTILIGNWATPARAWSVSEFLRKYQLGLTYTSTRDGVSLRYEVEADGRLQEGCEAEPDNPGVKTCKEEIRGGGSDGAGIIFQPAFKRQGLLYFDYDVGFALRSYAGSLPADRAGRDGLPLKNARFNLGAALIKPYIQFGITPANQFPDLLISLGPTAQVAAGETSINGEKKRVILANSGIVQLTGFTEVELVFWRFGNGLFSLFKETDFTQGKGSRFFPGDVDGMTNFRADFDHSTSGRYNGFGAKLLFDWP